jgi:hypothetical protein
MNALQRALVEKAGHDNGWEVTLAKSADSVTLGSSQHEGTVRVSCPVDGLSFECLFPDQIARSELTRSFPALAQPDGSFLVASSGDVLPRLLQRAAQLQRSLPSVPEKEYARQVAEALAGDSAAMQTEVEAIVKRRVGQNVFRSALMDYWGGKCAVTGVAVPEVLRASHCKPWADCSSDAERLDVYNGLLLTANLDALFDKGLISFTDQGEILISDALPASDFPNLGVCKALTLRHTSPNHHPYLAYHRKQVFEKGEK